jgi:hypothetical protein
VWNAVLDGRSLPRGCIFLSIQAATATIERPPTNLVHPLYSSICLNNQCPAISTRPLGAGRGLYVLTSAKDSHSDFKFYLRYYSLIFTNFELPLSRAQPGFVSVPSVQPYNDRPAGNQRQHVGADESACDIFCITLEHNSGSNKLL